MIKVDYDDLPQAIKSQYKRKRFVSAERRSDGSYDVVDFRGAHHWVCYERCGWRRQ